MNYIEIGIIFIVISSIPFGIFLYLYHKKGNDLLIIGSWIFGGMLVAGAIGTGAYAGASYFDALTLPYDYQAAYNTVNETTQLLMRYDHIQNGSFNSVGYGLEAQDLKMSLKDAIQTKNELRAQILSRLNDPMACYKNVLLDRLPADFS